jgi:hypothetical protein
MDIKLVRQMVNEGINPVFTINELVNHEKISQMTPEQAAKRFTIKAMKTAAFELTDDNYGTKSAPTPTGKKALQVLKAALKLRGHKFSAKDITAEDLDEGKLPEDPSKVDKPTEEIQQLAEDLFEPASEDEVKLRKTSPEGQKYVKEEQLFELRSDLASVINEWIINNLESVRNFSYTDISGLIADAGEFAVLHNEEGLWESKILESHSYFVSWTDTEGKKHEKNVPTQLDVFLFKKQLEKAGATDIDVEMLHMGEDR